MDGVVKSARDKLAELEERLDSYEKKVGLVIAPRESKYLNISLEEIKAMSAEELDEAAFDLGAYSLFLQKEINKHSTRVNWATANQKKIIAHECNNVRAPSFEERKLIIIDSNEGAAKLELIRIESQAVVDRFSFINHRIDFLAERVSRLKDTKRRNKYA